MTCIVGLIDKGNVLIGADSIASNYQNTWVLRNRKVFRRGVYIMGFTGSPRMQQLIMYAGEDPPRPPQKKTDLHRFLCMDWVNWVREIYKSGGILRTQEGVESAGSFLVATQGRLFHVESDFQVGESACGFDAVGSGDEVALGSLFTSKDMPPRKRIHTALAAAEQWCEGVGRPFRILTLSPPQEKKTPPSSPTTTE